MIDFIINTVVFVVVVLSFLALLILLYSSTNKSKKFAMSLVQAEIDKNLLFDKIKEFDQRIESIKLERSDEFVKFLSESREAAFTYIEDVQVAINALKTSVDNNDEEETALAHKHLFELLPKQENK
jgi:hypothetical protein